MYNIIYLRHKIYVDSPWVSHKVCHNCRQIPLLKMLKSNEKCGIQLTVEIFLYINQLRITFVVGLIETLLRSCLGKVVSCQGIPVYGVGVALLEAYPFRFSLNHYVSLLVDWFIA